MTKVAPKTGKRCIFDFWVVTLACSVAKETCTARRIATCTSKTWKTPEEQGIKLDHPPKVNQIAGCPRHVAIIMDGNGRWATQRGRPRLFGHHAGARRVREIVESCPYIGVKYLTIFAFSTENWKRTQVEVAGLMSLFKRYIVRETQALNANGVCVRFIGDRVRLDSSLRHLMSELETATAGNTNVHLTIAINYGGRDEVARATKRLAQDVANGRLKPDSVNEETLPRYLDTHVLPDPDLVIRTSGEARISNFLLWQSAYSEYEFVDTLWPDFTRDEFEDLCTSFAERDRRFGGVKS